MGIIQLPSVGDEPSLEELVDYIERLRKELTWLLDKNIDTKNARELGGWLIRPDKIVSVDGDVGMSTVDTTDDDIRFFAGPDGTVYNFYVTKGGKLTATGALIRSTNGSYPNVEFNGSGNIFKASKSDTEYIAISPSYTGSPTLLFESEHAKGFTSAADLLGYLWINATVGDVAIQSQLGNIYMFPNGYVKFENWTKIKGSTQTLQEVIDALEGQIDQKQDRVTSGDVTIIDGVSYLSNTGITPGIYPKAAYDATGRATAGFNLVDADIPTLAQSKITNLTTDLAAKQASDPTLTALAAFNSNGIMKQTAADTFTAVAAPIGAIVGTTDTQTLTNKSISGSQIDSGTIPVARIPTAIPATSIGGGGVSDAEYGYLDGVTSAIQTQLDGKASKNQEAWIAPTLLNSWANFGFTWENAGYFKDTLGIVHLRGLIAAGTVTQETIIFTLPTGYRPLALIMSGSISALGACSFKIDDSGNVRVFGGVSSTWTSLANITFRAEQ